MHHRGAASSLLSSVKRARDLFRTGRCTYATSANPNHVRIVEVGPRDGLQNEKAIIPPQLKAELVTRLGRAGLKNIESGSFVSPKWVPQMAGTAEVLTSMERLEGNHYPVLVPNVKGLDMLLSLLSEHPPSPSSEPLTDEIAVFTAATDAFSLANTNCTIAESLERLQDVTGQALSQGLRVRGYVSVVAVCPYTGKVDPLRVKAITRALLDMGCYEVSLGDTVGAGTPAAITELLTTVMGDDRGVPPSKLAVHFHDTYGTSLINIFLALSMGIRTIDAAVGGLGGCPYSPGATGNVATEDVLYALRDSGHEVDGNLDAVAEVGAWISAQLGRPNASRAGKALLARKERQRDGGAAESVTAKL
ncbi:aldolase [Sparassis latifolia]|uniref:hydroxymethylglutaryl-CoA lyase n=1 Tax=Sparassis crispa TaxID=139825 RepID=A0A401GN55_9APHY|nr:aldolase [Sparassis crispa]GBE83643.1 aldolase [Sparassis crispa]